MRIGSFNFFTVDHPDDIGNKVACHSIRGSRRWSLRTWVGANFAPYAGVGALAGEDDLIVAARFLNGGQHAQAGIIIDAQGDDVFFVLIGRSASHDPVSKPGQRDRSRGG